MQLGMRPGPIGPPQPQQQRAPNGAPFQSPTMAHSPQHSGNPPGVMPNQSMVGVPGMVGSQPPLTQMNNRGNMPPPGTPGGPPSMMGQPGTHGQAPQQGFPPLGSQPGSPANQGNMAGPSPSMAHRQPQGGAPQQSVNDLNRDLSQINASSLTAFKNEVGLADKDFPSLTVDEKVCFVPSFALHFGLRKYLPSKSGESWILPERGAV